MRLPWLKLLGFLSVSRIGAVEDEGVSNTCQDEGASCAAPSSPAFDGLASTSAELVAEIYKRVQMDREAMEVEVLAQALRRAVLSLSLESGDAFLELGSRTGWLPLTVALESRADQVLGLTYGEEVSNITRQVRQTLDELAPGRLAGRFDFIHVPDLDRFVLEAAWGSGAADGELANVTAARADLSKALQDSSVLTLNSADFRYGGDLDAMSALAGALAPGTVLVVLGADSTKQSFCTPGLMPIMAPVQLPILEEAELFTSMRAFVVAPRATSVAALQLPNFGSLSEALRSSSVRKNVTGGVAEALRAAGAVALAPGQGSEEGQRMVLHSELKHIFDLHRSRRMQLALRGGGLVGQKTGELLPQDAAAAQSADPAALPLEPLAELFASRFLGSAPSAYACVESNAYWQASAAPRITKQERAAGLFPAQTATYGEIAPEGLQNLLDRFGGIAEQDVFFDLGSGLGKAVLQIFLSTAAGRVVGVELAETRHAGATDALDALRARFPTVLEEANRTGRSLELLHLDILKADLTGVTWIWMGSLAFPPELMTTIASKLLQEASVGCRVVTMVPFPEDALAHSAAGRRWTEPEIVKTAVRWTEKPHKAMMYKIV